MAYKEKGSKRGMATSRREFVKTAAVVALSSTGILGASGMGCGKAAETITQPALAMEPNTAQAGNGTRPNVLLILADDLGWSDLGCYGGEIQTPSIDALGKDGLRFTQFYNSARCCPSRASLLTGLHPHQAGFPLMSGTLVDNCVTLPEVLKTAGYQTYMVGKWHLGNQKGPTVRGFDEFYGMLGGFNTYWKEEPYYTRLPEGRAKREYKPGEFYSTNVFGDYALDFLTEGQKAGKPWFMYLSFNAPHFPLHAPEAVIEKYETLYRTKGWDAMRAERLARQKKLGLVPQDLELAPREPIPANFINKQTGWADKPVPAWDTLPPDRQADLARRMAVYAACVDIMDQNVGRVVDHLKKMNQWDNTLVFFLSDNGACAEWDPFGFDQLDSPKNVVHTGEQLKWVGGPESYISYGSGWANACDTPWRLYKHYTQEGGIRTPLIVHWPKGLQTKPGSLTNQPGFVGDFMATLVDVCGATYPKERNGVAILPTEGESIAPVFQNKPLKPRLLYAEHEGNRMARDKDWKLVALAGKPWELYDLSKDPTELRDLANSQPDRVKKMSAEWYAWAERCNVTHREGRGGKKGTNGKNPQIAGHPLTISCDVTPKSAGSSGVLLAQGGNQRGYALYLNAGKPVFAVRENNKLTEITANDAPKGKFSLEARLAKDGTMTLSINGKVAATGKAPGLITAQPQDGLSIGEDQLSAVGNYAPPHPFAGTVERVRVETGETSESAD